MKSFVFPLSLAGLVGVVFVPLSTRAAGENDTRLDLPESREIQQAQSEIRTAYGGTDFSEKYRALVIQNADRPARVYALLDRAADQFLSRRQYAAAWSCLQELAKRFRFDLPVEGYERLSAAEQKIKELPTRDQKLAGECLFPIVEALVDVSIAAQNYEVASKGCNLLKKAAERVEKYPRKSSPFKDAATAAELRLRNAPLADALAQTAADRLKRLSNDTEASQILGLYLCLYKSDWQTGIRCLSNASNASIRAAATFEVNINRALPTTGEDTYKAAAAWGRASREELFSTTDLPWAAARTTLLRHEKDLTERALWLGITNEIDRKVASQRRSELMQLLGLCPHFVVGAWVRADRKAGWTREFKSAGEVVASFEGQQVTLMWYPDPEFEERVCVIANDGYRWSCVRRDGDQLLIEEIDRNGRVNFSELHSRAHR